jgi:hypothetical protein
LCISSCIELFVKLFVKCATSLWNRVMPERHSLSSAFILMTITSQFPRGYFPSEWSRIVKGGANAESEASLDNPAERTTLRSRGNTEKQKTLTRRRRLVIRVHLLFLLFAPEKSISGENNIWLGEASLDELA